MLTMIAAQDRNRAIGRGNALPWHIPEDLAFFREMTRGHIVIMGRKTWESLPRRPLPDRLNVVLTRSGTRRVDGALFIDLPSALEMIGGREAFCIGGAEIYAACLPHAKRLLITHVETEIEDPDAYFPEIGPEWVESRNMTLRREAPVCEMREYLRRRS